MFSSEAQAAIAAEEAAETLQQEQNAEQATAAASAAAANAAETSTAATATATVEAASIDAMLGSVGLPVQQHRLLVLWWIRACQINAPPSTEPADQYSQSIHRQAKYRQMHKGKLNRNAPVSIRQLGNLSEQKWGCNPSTRVANLRDFIRTRAVIGKHQTDRETIIQEIAKHQHDLPQGLRPSTVRLWSSTTSPNRLSRSVPRHSLSRSKAIATSSWFWWAFLSQQRESSSLKLPG
jgi:hypothetical protein